jgi:hypothetical protein
MPLGAATCPVQHWQELSITVSCLKRDRGPVIGRTLGLMIPSINDSFGVDTA